MDNLLSDALKSDLITVVAGSGYGKTEAVYSFLRNRDFCIVWVQISEDDDTPTRFWETFTKAIFTVSPATAKILKDLGFPKDGSLFGKYAAVMADALSVTRKYVIVFDDFHLLKSPSILKFIGKGIHRHFPGMSRIFIAREDPAAFILNHLSTNTVSHLNEDDLRFTKEETKELFALHGIRLNEEVMEHIYADTDGWIFAINLVGLFYKRNPGPAGYAISAMKSNLSKLIDSELFSNITEEQQHFLIRMSLIHHLPQELLGRLPDGIRLMDELRPVNSFIRYDAYLDTYRIHNLLYDYLKEKQSLLTEEEKRETYEVAANWCLTKGYILDAASYFHQLNDYDRIVEIAYGLPLLLPPGLGAYFAEILTGAPQDAFGRNGTLNVVYARLLLGLDRLEEAEEFIRSTLQRTESLPESDYKNRVLFGLYTNLGFLGLIRAPKSGRYDFAAHFRVGDDYFKKSNYRVWGAGRSINLSPFICRVGRSDPGGLDLYIGALTELVPFVSHSMDGCMYGLDDLARCELSFFRDDLDACERYGYEALYKARAREQHEIENRALFFLLRASLAGGKYGDVEAILSQVEAQPDLADYTNRHFMKDIVTGWFYAQVGYPERVASWITNDIDEREVNYLLQGLEFVAKNKYDISQKRYVQLLALLDSQDTDSGMSVFLFGKISIAIHKAVCLYNINEKAAALWWFGEAYALAAPSAVFMPFIELGNEMRALAHFALKTGCTIPTEILEMLQGKANTYTKRLAHIGAKLGDDETTHDTMYLTSREKEILTDLAQGLSRIEIAEAHHLSINTVKTSLPHIFQKLGANNTIDAVRIALANKIVE
ncbi:hypothetical protein AGMMS49983_19200 [Clostridia bacterium]|nr:hypothetical protein AGMMS49983_19200 [Clostridia bacterium]